jgi:plastocyanin
VRKLGIVLAAALVFVPSGSLAATGPLVGTVGPGFSISIKDSSGTTVKNLDPGSYTVQVHDLAVAHDLHLVGPGVDQATDVEGTGDFTWAVTFSNGTYRYFCDVHPTLRGSFVAGTEPPVRVLKLAAKVGPGSKISVTTPAGARVKQTLAGVYSLAVRDASARDNFHLTGPKVNRKTSVAKKQKVTWKLTLRAGTYRYRSDAHPRLKGSFTVKAVT